MKNLLPLFFLFLVSIDSVKGQPYFPEQGQAYRTDVLPRIDITINEDTLQWIYDNVDSDKEFRALFVYSAGGNTDTVQEVGFRLRGASSRISAKKSFKVSFNTFNQGGKFYGIEKMNLNGEHNDPSIIRSHLTWNLFEQMKVPAPRSNHVEVYINDRYYGLYINVEQIDEEFVESRFGNNLGNLYKCLFPADLMYLGTNTDDYKNNGYTLKTNTEKDDYSDLINFIYILNNTEPDDFPASVEPVFNVNSFLRNLAIEVFTGHWDAYSINRNNYYLFNNFFTGKFEFIPYDTDNTFGIDWYNIDWANRDIYHWWNQDENRPLTEKIFGNPVYRDRFSFFLHELITSYGDPNTFFPEIDAIKLKIDVAAAADEYRPDDYGWTYDDYTHSYTEALGAHVKYGLKPYISTRINSINQQLDLTPIAPIIENVNRNFPQLNQPLSVHVTITDDQPDPAGKIYYKVNDGPFQMIVLTPVSGTDFIAGIPGVSEPSVISYYIEATDASMNTTREPSFNKYSVSIGVSDNRLMITEFMAGNSNTISDNYGANEDWIEIKNTGSEAISLDGKYLSDDLSDPVMFNLPDILLEPNEYYIIWADNDREQGPDHANFRLSTDGESIGLFDSYETGFASLAAFDYSTQDANVSMGLNGAMEWEQQAIITPGGDNNSADVAFVTFRFDMRNEIAAGNFEPSVDFIDVAGNFNNWTGDVPVFDGNADGVFQYTSFGFSTGENIEYKARINADWNTSEFPELGAAGNRFYTLAPGHNIIGHIYNDEGTGVDGTTANAMFTFYPNPAVSGEITLEAAFVMEAVSIFTTTGTMIYHSDKIVSNFSKAYFDLKPGIYILKVIAGTNEYTKKLVVY